MINVCIILLTIIYSSTYLLSSTMEPFNKIPAEAVYVLIAAVGGTTRYLQHYLNEGIFAWKHFLAHVFVSSFSGYMFYLFATNVFGFPDTTVAIFAGLGGWMGVEALKMIETYLRDKFKTDKDE